MAKFFFSFFVFFPLFSAGQKNIPVGLGVLKIDFTKLPVLQFYSDTAMKASVKTIRITKNPSEEFTIDNQTEADTWFKPEQLFFEYDIFLIRVDSVVGNWFKVVVNSATGEILWTKADAAKKFIKWQTFLVKGLSSVDKGDFNLDIK